MARQPRQAVLFGEADSVAINAAGSGPEPRTSTSRPLSVAVIWISSGFPAGISGSASAQAASSAPLRPGSRIGQRSTGTMAWLNGRGETDLEHILSRRSAGVQRDAPAAGAVGVDQRIDLAGDACLRQRRDHEVAFPGAVVLGLPMLDRAAAADAEMWAERRDPLRAGVLDLEQAPAVGMMARHGRDLDGLAAQRVGHKTALSAGKGDAVAAMTDMIDDEAFNHGARR